MFFGPRESLVAPGQPSQARTFLNASFKRSQALRQPSGDATGAASRSLSPCHPPRPGKCSPSGAQCSVTVTNWWVLTL